MRIDLVTYKPNTANINQIDYARKPQFSSLSPLKTDTLSFVGGKGTIKLDTKEFEHLHCPYCGREMVTSHEIRKFRRTVPDMKGDKAVAAITHYTNRLRKGATQIKVSEMLVNELKHNPDITVKQAINNLLQRSEGPVLKEQSAIYSNILKISEKLPKDYQEKIKAVVPNPDIEYLKALKPQERQIVQKRKTLIDNIMSIYDEYKASGKTQFNKSFQAMFFEANKVPRAIDDADTFIVKYGNRDAGDFLEYLIIKLKSSADHIYLNKNIKANDPCDLIASCIDCNGERGDVEFQEWMNSNPVHFKNFSNHISELIEIYAQNKSKNQGVKDYISKLIMTSMRCLSEQSYMNINFKIQPENKFK